jgi:hypothetical protein
MLHRMDWPYFTLQEDGRLQTEDGDYLVAEDGKTPIFFGTREDAEQYLVEFDIRGTVR